MNQVCTLPKRNQPKPNQTKPARPVTSINSGRIPGSRTRRPPAPPAQNQTQHCSGSMVWTGSISPWRRPLACRVAPEMARVWVRWDVHFPPGVCNVPPGRPHWDQRAVCLGPARFGPVWFWFGWQVGLRLRRGVCDSELCGFQCLRLGHLRH